MKQGKHYSGLTFKEEIGTRLWFETPDGIPIAFEGKEDFIETYKKHRKIEVEQWKENESEMLQALQEDCQNLNRIIQTMGEENFINSMAECNVKYTDAVFDISSCNEQLINEYKTQKIYEDLSFSYADELLRDIWWIHIEHLLGANEKVLDKYLKDALEIEAYTKKAGCLSTLKDCYGLFIADEIKISECICSIYLSQEEMKIYREVENECRELTLYETPATKKALLARLFIKANVAVLKDVLKICEQLCK